MATAANGRPLSGPSGRISRRFACTPASRSPNKAGNDWLPAGRPLARCCAMKLVTKLCSTRRPGNTPWRNSVCGHQPDVRAPVADEVRQHRRVLRQRRLHDGARLGYRELVRGLDALLARAGGLRAAPRPRRCGAAGRAPVLAVVAAPRAALELTLQRSERIPQALDLGVAVPARPRCAVCASRSVSERARMVSAVRNACQLAIRSAGARRRDPPRCALRTARSSPPGIARASRDCRPSRGCAAPSPPRCPRPHRLHRRSPASSSASASAELESMRLKSSLRRA